MDVRLLAIAAAWFGHTACSLPGGRAAGAPAQDQRAPATSSRRDEPILLFPALMSTEAWLMAADIVVDGEGLSGFLGNYFVDSALGGDPNAEPMHPSRRTGDEQPEVIAPKVVGRYGRLLGPAASLRQETLRLVETRKGLEHSWEVEREWSHDNHVVAKSYAARDGARPILALADVLMEPAFRDEGDCLDIGGRDSECVGDEPSTLIYCIVKCPVHGVDVCRVGVPHEATSPEGAWHLFARIARFVTKRLATEFHGYPDRLVVWCPAGHHKVVVWQEERRR